MNCFSSSSRCCREMENVMTSHDCRFSCSEASLTPAGAARRVFLLGAAGASLAAGSLTTRRAPAAENGESVALFAYIGCTEVSSYAIDKASGRISFLNKQPTNGNNSTHLTPDPTNCYIVIGNGIGVAVFPINSNGSLAPYTDMVRAGGDVGSHRVQVEAGPHPHY